MDKYAKTVPGIFVMLLHQIFALTPWADQVPMEVQLNVGLALVAVLTWLLPNKLQGRNVITEAQAFQQLSPATQEAARRSVQ